jgi:peptidase M15-like protein
MRNQLLAAATSVTIVTLALPAAAGFPAGHSRTPTLLEHAAAPGQEPAPIVPPVPQPARRPHKSPAAAEPPDAPIVPPVPQLARRSQPPAAAIEASFAIIPPVPQLVRRPQQLAALSPEPIARPAPPPPSHRDRKSEQLIACLGAPVRELLERIEAQFGPMEIISTCRSGARVAGSGRISKHATGEAVDFEAGSRKREVVQWLVDNHKSGGTMTYSDMSHIHIDVGQHFVALDAYSGR